MVSKKQIKTRQVKAKKKKRTTRIILLSLTAVAVVGFLVFFVATLFESIYPPGGSAEKEISQREKIKTELFFADANERFLRPEVRYIPRGKDMPATVYDLVAALIDGPRTGLVRTIPEATTLNGVTLSNATAVIDFGPAFIETHPGGATSEMLTIYSLANTITTAVPSISKIKLRVQGKDLESINGHVDCRRAFLPDKELIARTSR
ncbi:MAG: GerMN domain-containing protein [Deltaproteobacteria bacterium]|nr:GerMN domain-containing protein [Deltaproteobacteria bacterium]